VVIAQRRWHTDQNRIYFSDLEEIGGGAKTFAPGTSDLLGFDTMDIRFTRIQPVNLGRIDIETGDPKSFLAEKQNQRQPYVAEANNPHPQLTLLNERQPL
jgi:hypothetical protein